MDDHIQENHYDSNIPKPQEMSDITGCPRNIQNNDRSQRGANYGSVNSTPNERHEVSGVFNEKVQRSSEKTPLINEAQTRYLERKPMSEFQFCVIMIGWTVVIVPIVAAFIYLLIFLILQ